VVYQITAYQRNILDRYEGLGQGYDLKLVETCDPCQNSVEVEIYFATDIDPEL
jgi:hypothetical protein